MGAATYQHTKKYVKPFANETPGTTHPGGILVQDNAGHRKRKLVAALDLWNWDQPAPPAALFSFSKDKGAMHGCRFTNENEALSRVRP